TLDIALVYLLWYPHFASAVEPCTPDLETVEVQVDDWCRVQRQQLAKNQAPDNRDAQWPPQLRSGPHAECQRQATQQRRHGGHDDGAEPQQTGLEDGGLWALALVAFGLEGEVDHHDGVLFHDTDEQNDTNHGDDAQIGPTE